MVDLIPSHPPWHLFHIVHVVTPGSTHAGERSIDRPPRMRRSEIDLETPNAIISSSLWLLDNPMKPRYRSLTQFDYFYGIDLNKKLLSKSNSNRLIFLLSLSHHIEKSIFSISTYIEEVLQQIDFPPFLYGKGDAMSPLSIGDWREIIGD